MLAKDVQYVLVIPDENRRLPNERLVRGGISRALRPARGPTVNVRPAVLVEVDDQVPQLLVRDPGVADLAVEVDVLDDAFERLRGGVLQGGQRLVQLARSSLSCERGCRTGATSGSGRAGWSNRLISSSPLDPQETR